MEHENLILRLYEAGTLKFGNFILKSGIESPVYFDLRIMVSFPPLMQEISDVLWDVAEKMGAKFDSICGVPYTALPIATLMAVKHDKPMLIRRKESKDYGTQKMIEGKIEKGAKCLIVEDIVTSGSSIFETSQALALVGLEVTDAVVLLDRNQGGIQKLKKSGINAQSVFTLRQVLDVLVKHDKIQATTKVEVDRFLNTNQFKPVSMFEPTKPLKLNLPYAARAKLCKHEVTKRLFTIMDDKETNLAFAADVSSSEELLKLAKLLGPHICIFKTHMDILFDFSMDVVQQLKAIAKEHNFLIFEDRKFADIGNTVKNQYGAGAQRIVDWADIVNAHGVPGKGVIEGLRDAAKGKPRGCLLIAEMSSKGNLATGNYTKATVKIAEEMSEFVIGFISQSAVSEDPSMVHMTPGVKLHPGPGSLGQQYLTPLEVIGVKGSDIIIVGRDIYESSNRLAAALEYKKAGYQAYLTRMVHRKSISD